MYSQYYPNMLSTVSVHSSFFIRMTFPPFIFFPMGWCFDLSINTGQEEAAAGGEQTAVIQLGWEKLCSQPVNVETWEEICIRAGWGLWHLNSTPAPTPNICCWTFVHLLRNTGKKTPKQQQQNKHKETNKIKQKPQTNKNPQDKTKTKQTNPHF